MLDIKSLPQKETETYFYRIKEFKGLNMHDDGTVMDFEESPDAVNVRFDGGRLKRIKGFGIATWLKDGEQVILRQLPESVVRLFEFQASSPDDEGYKNFYFSGDEGNLYKFTYDSTLKKICAVKVENESGETGIYTYFTQFRLGKENCALLGGPQCGPYIYKEDGKYKLITGDNKPKMKRTAMHYGRMFGVGDPGYPQRIWFSAIDEPGNFAVSETAGGYIEISDMTGNAIDVISYFDTLYVFCRYGIAALNTLSVQSDFSLENIYYSDSEIIEGSVCVCGSRILFATRYGVYALSGSTVTKVSEKIDGFFENVVCKEETSVYFAGQYFLSFNKSDGAKGMLIFDLLSRRWQIFSGTMPSSMAVFRGKNEEKLLISQGTSGVVPQWGTGDFLTNSGAIIAKWKSPVTDWGISGSKKRVREVHLTASGSGTLNVKISADGSTQTRTVTLSADDKLFRLPFDIEGNLVGIELSNSNGNDFSVGPVTFIYTLKREKVN